jgi:hypothetical protein
MNTVIVVKEKVPVVQVTCQAKPSVTCESSESSQY